MVTMKIVTSSAQRRRPNQSRNKEDAETMCGLLFNTLASLFQQGIDYTDTRISSRIAFTSIIIAIVVFFATYSASLTSFLAVYKLNMPFEGIEDLLTNTQFKVTTIGGNSIDKYLQSIVQDRTRYKTVRSLQEGFTSTLDGHMAFVWEMESIDAFIGQSCDYVKAKKPAYKALIGIGLQKHSEYSGILNH